MKIGAATSADLRQSALQPMYHNDVALLRRSILDGVDENGKPLDPAMPRWKGQLSDTQVDSIIAYLKTLKEPEAVTKKTLQKYQVFFVR